MPPLACEDLSELGKPTLLMTGERSLPSLYLVTAELERCLEGESHVTNAPRSATRSLEDALLKHPGVRVAVVHSGWPMVDEMISILYRHPQVCAEVGLLQLTELFPRAEYYAFLRRLVRAGFADRILFGSDGALTEGIAAILEADFLTEQQQRDILCGNAARFLRPEEGTC